MADRLRYWTVNNVRTNELQETLNRYADNGWTLDRVVAIAGDIGSTFTVIFRRDAA